MCRRKSLSSLYTTNRQKKTASRAHALSTFQASLIAYPVRLCAPAKSNTLRQWRVHYGYCTWRLRFCVCLCVIHVLCTCVYNRTRNQIKRSRVDLSILSKAIYIYTLSDLLLLQTAFISLLSVIHLGDFFVIIIYTS